QGRRRDKGRGGRLPEHLLRARATFDLPDLLAERLAEPLARATLETIEPAAKPLDDLIELGLRAAPAEALHPRCDREAQDGDDRAERPEERDRLTACEPARIDVARDTRPQLGDVGVDGATQKRQLALGPCRAARLG